MGDCGVADNVSISRARYSLVRSSPSQICLSLHQNLSRSCLLRQDVAIVYMIAHITHPRQHLVPPCLQTLAFPDAFVQHRLELSSCWT